MQGQSAHSRRTPGTIAGYISLNLLATGLFSTAAIVLIAAPPYDYAYTIIIAAGQNILTLAASLLALFNANKKVSGSPVLSVVSYYAGPALMMILSLIGGMYIYLLPFIIIHMCNFERLRAWLSQNRRKIRMTNTATAAMAVAILGISAVVHAKKYATHQTNSTVLHGYVTDSGGAALEGVAVHLNDAPETSATTDSSGYFAMPRPGNFLPELVFSKEGYISDTIPTVSGHHGETVEFRFLRSPGQVTLHRAEPDTTKTIND